MIIPTLGELVFLFAGVVRLNEGKDRRGRGVKEGDWGQGGGDKEKDQRAPFLREFSLLGQIWRKNAKKRSGMCIHHDGKNTHIGSSRVSRIQRLLSSYSGVNKKLVSSDQGKVAS